MNGQDQLKEFREDGWPLCPACGEDELWSPLLWNLPGNNEEVPPVQVFIDAGLKCYRCGWSLPAKEAKNG